MRAYFVGRLLQMVPVLILVTMVSFSLILLLPGDPIQSMIGIGSELTPEQIKIARHELGLDRPIPVQYFMWLGKIITGDLGTSATIRTPVADELMVRLPVTLQLGVAALLFSLLIGIPAGIISAVYRGSKLDLFTTVVTMGGVAVPSFWLGMALILIFSVRLGWLPPYGFVDIFENPVEGIKSLIMPAFCLGLYAAAINARQMRSSMLEVLGEDYVRTARAKGLKESTVIGVHALRNALLPVVTITGVQIGRLIGGAVVIETLFAMPGMGRFMVTSILSRDFPVVQACVLLTAVAVLIANLAADFLYAYLDPRISLGRKLG